MTLSLAAAAALMAPLSAQAATTARPTTNITQDVFSFLGFGADQANNPTDPAQITEPMRPAVELQPRVIEHPEIAIEQVRLPKQGPAEPSVVRAAKRLFCVEYARMRSGLAVFGDARHWWDRAKNLYARASHPVEEAVMVFSGSKRLKRGHVAVVTDIVSPRQIIVDQANWQNKGEIDHATPVLDVSAGNDWSLVRVWDMRSNGFGTHVYAISGFIAKGMTTASRD
jgi:hypothetical protein